MRLLALAAAALALGAAVALAAPGDPDATFDGDGVRTFDFQGTDEFRDVVAQPDGKLVVVGTGNPNADLLVLRLNPDGTNDPSFNADGDGDSAPGTSVSAWDEAQAVALQRDGKIVVVGSTAVLAGMDREHDWLIMRFNPNGSLDGSFDGDGIRTIEYQGLSDVARDVAIQPDGKIVVVGTANTNEDFTVARLNPDGSTDTAFQDDGDGDGAPGTEIGGSDSPAAVALQADGKIAVVGSVSLNTAWALMRLNSDGSQDSSFDGDGVRTVDFGGADYASDVQSLPGGKLLVAGEGTFKSTALVARFNAGGALDPSFDSDGDGDGTPGVDLGESENADAMALQANGKIVLVGARYIQSIVMRLQPGGSLDTTFTPKGYVTLDVPNFHEAVGVAVLPSGGIAVAGNAYNLDDAYVARVEGDPRAAGGGPPTGGGGPRGGGGAKGGVPRCAGKRATIVGTNKRDRLRGTRRADVIVALRGNDSIKGGRGNDLICAGDGNDRVDGELGNDRVFGQNGVDALNGGKGSDSLNGGAAKDRIAGGQGRDKCVGGAGRDRATCERENGI